MQKALALHSRYNPTAEAERYINSLKLNEGIRFFILIEPGMGYLVSCLRKINPGAKIISLYAENPPESIPCENNADAFWSPGSDTDMSSFLERQIPDVRAEAIKMIEWRPAHAIYGGAYRNLLTEAARFIKQTDACARTVEQFGRRWFRNFFRNINLLSKIITPLSFSFPVLVTGAGPGLENTLPVIRQRKEDVYIIAVSSSAAALLAGNIKPDLVISVDGGGWASLHLYECLRGRQSTDFAFNLTAAIPSQCAMSPVLVISDGSVWQNLLLCALQIPFITLPQRGTVSASALDLAFAVSSGSVYFTGVDLSNYDIRSHARPYSFDRIWDEKASRLCPVYSQEYSRSGSIRDGGSHSIYASWFRHQLASYPKRLFSLGSNSEVFRRLETASIVNTAGNTKKPVPEYKTLNHSEKPSVTATRVLKQALLETTGSQLAKSLYDELTVLLLPGQSPSMPELVDAVSKLASPRELL